MKTKYLLIIAGGIFTTIISFWVIAPAVVAMRDSESSDIALVLLALGVLLALTSSGLVWDGYRHLKRAA
jgi:hypothetical protein